MEPCIERFRSSLFLLFQMNVSSSVSQNGAGNSMWRGMVNEGFIKGLFTESQKNQPGMVKHPRASSREKYYPSPPPTPRPERGKGTIADMGTPWEL